MVKQLKQFVNPLMPQQCKMFHLYQNNAFNKWNSDFILSVIYQIQLLPG
jgi:hypothetical protein